MTGRPPRPLSPQGPPLPTPRVSEQWWRDACFVHWRTDPALVAPLLPRGVRPDLFDGHAWVGLVPFRMDGAGLPGRGGVPWLGSFLELNVRTYSVDDQGRRGVVFRTLEAERAAVVLGARALLDVPYRWARMRFAREQDPDGRTVLDYRSRRRGPSRRGRPASRLRVAVGERIDRPGPLEVFLTARFGLHTPWWGRPLWVPNTHGPWPLHRGELLELEDSLVRDSGFGRLAARLPDSVLCSPGVRTGFGLPLGLGDPR